MIRVSNEELSKIAQFVASCDDMINGKFILADVKITKVLNMIAGSEELYRYISECMVGFDFAKEYHRAEVKNSLNGGVFAVPSDPNKLVAFVFCILVECDAKRMDFYTFINENFALESRADAYKNFAGKLLVPFKEVVSSHFGLGGASEEAIASMTQDYREDLKNAPIFEEQNNQTNYENDIWESDQYQHVESFQNNQYENQNDLKFDNTYQNQNAQSQSMQNFNNMRNQNYETSQPKKFNDVWAEIGEICENVESAVYAERHIKDYLREELLYILKTLKYSTKYKDIKIVSALATAFDEMTKKFRSVQFVFGELKNKLEKMY